MSPEREFLTEEVPRLLETLTPNATRYWGKMSPQHMVEHVAGLFVLSTKPNHEQPIFIPEDKFSKAVAWLWTDKAFRQNTKAPIMPDEPLPLRFADLAEAKEKFGISLNRFYEFFLPNIDLKVVHPAFGPLNGTEWQRFHYKHVQHHFRQFGLLPQLPQEQP
ncbi:MAG: DUF1569 domain-containing protein [Bacteroidia bacterium]|nr:DUF1569 domain-containing protein [Bacteroidia bacterium]